MLINQQLPLLYRQLFISINNQIYDEEEYEMNNVLILKKVASFLCTLAFGVEPASSQEMFNTLKVWH